MEGSTCTPSYTFPPIPHANLVTGIAPFPDRLLPSCDCWRVYGNTDNEAWCCKSWMWIEGVQKCTCWLAMEMGSLGEENVRPLFLKGGFCHPIEVAQASEVTGSSCVTFRKIPNLCRLMYASVIWHWGSGSRLLSIERNYVYENVFLWDKC